MTKLASLLLALLLVCCMGVTPALATQSSSGQPITLPTTPPEVDDTPIEPAEPPQPLPDSPAPSPAAVIPLPESTASQPAQSPAPNTLDSILTTETVVLLGLVIWYVLTLVGIVGGRRPRRHTGRAL